jgi:hypothetical protein
VAAGDAQCRGAAALGEVEGGDDAAAGGWERTSEGRQEEGGEEAA